jgi:cytochrome c7-like protein
MSEQTPETSRRRGILIGGLSFLVAFAVVLLWPWPAHVVQPIQYNHQKHLNAGLECSNCHTLYSSSPFAGLPTIDACAMCHSEKSSGTPEEAKIVELVQKNQPLVWKQVNQLPTHVYFSHQTHAVAGGIACAVCHGDMQKRTTPPSAPLFTWKMNACLNCHAQRGATVDCDGCHR